ncbi:MAG: hypothetical protein KIG65_05325, partial [Eubacteriales bacterium]|nr:hypothetical protein [Eubacteriales bacterium]
IIQRNNIITGRSDMYMKKNSKKPFREDYNMSRITTKNIASNTECTGLTPTPIDSSEERDAYADIFNFFPEDIANRTDNK